jgi:hypothetical protein
VEGLGKPVSPTALIAGGRGEPQGAGASRRKGRRFPAPSPRASPSDEGEGADLLPTQNPEEPLFDAVMKDGIRYSANLDRVK